MRAPPCGAADWLSVDPWPPPALAEAGRTRGMYLLECVQSHPDPAGAAKRLCNSMYAGRLRHAPGKGGGCDPNQADPLWIVYGGAASAVLFGAHGGWLPDAAICRRAFPLRGRDWNGGAFPGAGYPERFVRGAGGHGCDGALNQQAAKCNNDQKSLRRNAFSKNNAQFTIVFGYETMEFVQTPSAQIDSQDSSSQIFPCLSSFGQNSL